MGNYFNLFLVFVHIWSSFTPFWKSYQYIRGMLAISYWMLVFKFWWILGRFTYCRLNISKNTIKKSQVDKFEEQAGHLKSPLNSSHINRANRHPVIPTCHLAIFLNLVFEISYFKHRIYSLLVCCMLVCIGICKF